jgi:hypothetical protein
MTLYTVNTGNGPNSHDGDSLRTAFNKINANFSQINTGSLGAVLVQSPSVPQGYGPGTLWYDTESGRTYIYYNNSWVDSNPSSNQNNSNVSVSLYDPDTQENSNTVTNVTSINFDSLADFSVTDQGGGSVLVGMNSTFKYIQIAGQPTLAAQGVDTLTLVAGTGTQLITSNAGLKNQQTITFISTGSGSGNATFPSTSTSGFLYTDGSNNISWQTLSASTLTNGSAKFGLNSDGSVTFNNNTKQSTAYVAPVSDSTNLNHNLVFLGNTGAFQFNGSLYFNPSTRQFGKITTLLFNDNTAQTTAWLGTTSTLATSSGGATATLRISTTTLTLSTGTITFPDLSVQRTAYTGTVEYSKLTGVPIVTTSSINNNGFTAGLTTSGIFTLSGPIIIKNSSTNIFSISTWTSGALLATLSTVSSITIQTTSTSSIYNWTFNNNGTVTFPDGTTQFTAGRNIYDYIFSGTQRLSITSNGVVKFPDGTNQTTAFVGTATSLQNGNYRLRPVAVPTNVQYGSPTDKVGDIAFDQNYLYYCIAAYGSKSYTAVTYDARTLKDFIIILQSSTNGYTPQQYWTFQQQGNDTVYVVDRVETAAVRTDVVYILYSNNASLTYPQGTTFYVTNTSPSIPNWAKTVITTVGLVSSLANFVNPSTIVSNNIINVQWNPVIEFNENHLQLNISTKSGIISEISYNVTAATTGAPAVFSGVLQQLTATMVPLGPTTATPGDTIIVLLTSYTSKLSYRITAMVGQNLINNFIGIEQLL